MIDFKFLKFTFLAAFLGLVFIANGQDNAETTVVKPKRNFLSLEASTGFSLSQIVYERLLVESRYHHLMARAGLNLELGSILRFFASPTIRVPIGLIYLIGNKNHFAEIGAGAYYTHFTSYNFTTNNDVGVNFIVPYGSVGYRYQFSQIPVFLSLKGVISPSSSVVFALGFKF